MPDNPPKSQIRRHIDENLRRIYDETLNEALPDNLTRLLEQLRQKTAPDAPPDDEKGQS